MSSKKTKRQLTLFLVITFAVSFALQGYIIQNQGLGHINHLWIVALMWVPGLTSLIYRFVGKLGFDDVGIQIGKPKYWVVAFTLPLALATLSYSLTWILHINEWRSPPQALLDRAGATNSFQLILIKYPQLLLFGSFAALGEELGWRGFLIPKLTETNIKYPLTLSALIWGAWHTPMILWGGYATSDMPIVSVALFMVMITFGGIFAGWIRMASGSVWVATLYHASHNLFMQTAFEIFNKPGALNQYLGGESGVIPCVVMALLFLGGRRLFSKTGNSCPLPPPFRNL